MIANPSHPGELIREDILPAYGLTVTAAAEILRIARPNLTRVLNGQAALTPELALKVEKAFGTSAQLLVNMQAAFDLDQVRRTSTVTDAVQRQTLPAG